MAFDIKHPISMYQGIFKHVNDDNIGRSYFSNNFTYNYKNNNDVVTTFSRIFTNTTLGSFTLKLQDTDLNAGDIIRIIDVKKTFLNHPLEINPQSKKINESNSNVIFTTSGAIIDFIYTNEEVGWVVFMGGKLRTDLTNFIEYNIGPSEVGNRTGLVVCQSGTPNTVQLASTLSLDRMPVLGIIRKDKGSTVLTQTYNIDVVEVQLDSNSIDPKPKDFLFLSDEAGYLTNDVSFQGIIHKVGIVKDVVSSKIVLANFFPEPEYILNMCESYEVFEDNEIVNLDAGDNYQVFVDNSGQIWSQGVNNYGQLGLSSTIDRNDPAKIEHPCPVNDIACGDYHTLIIDSDYNIWSTGRNNYGQLGVGNQMDASSPTKLMVEE